MSTRSITAQVSTQTQQQRLYTLRVFIIDGPLSEDFMAANPMVSRKIEILGTQTLSDLHRAIFNAFERTEEHLYEFQIGGKSPTDPNNRLYVLSSEMKREDDSINVAGDVAKTTLDDVGLTVNELFGYWFDLGDDWWHQITVVDIKSTQVSQIYPRVIERIGMSPPQFSNWEDDDDDQPLRE